MTSRQVLNLGTEAQIQVIPLAVPPVLASPAEIAGNASVKLFLNLARRERPELDLRSERANSIARICRRLDGLPLALGLAASHIGLLEPDEMEQRLVEHLQHLRNTSQVAEPRHRTLRSMIEWSDDLLSEEERLSFHKLSVFAGGFNFEAAIQVLGEEQESADVLEILRSLVAKNLLYRTKTLGTPRLHMLDTIREYAGERLRASGTEAEYRRRHAAYFLGLAQVAAPKVQSRDQRDHVETLFEEAGNLRAAPGWLSAQPSAADSSKLLEALKWFWITRGQFSEALEWTDKVLRQAQGAGEPTNLASVLNTAGWLRYLAGNPEGALDVAVASHDLYQHLDQTQGVATSGLIAGIAKAISGQVPQGSEMVLKSLEHFRAFGDDHGTALGLITVGEGLRAEGLEAEAETFYDEALTLLEKQDNTFWPGLLKQNKAHFRLHEGKWQKAAKLALEALSLAETYDYPMANTLAVAALGGVHAAKGNMTHAARIVAAVEARLAMQGAHFEPTDAADLQRVKEAIAKTLEPKDLAQSSAIGAKESWEETLELARACL